MGGVCGNLWGMLKTYISHENPEDRRPLGRCSPIFKNSIKIDCKEMGSGDEDLFKASQSTVRGRFFDSVMNFRVT